METIPYELLATHFTNCLDIEDVVNLCKTSRMYNQLCDDNGFWFHRIIRDFGKSYKGFAPKEYYLYEYWKSVSGALRIPELYPGRKLINTDIIIWKGGTTHVELIIDAKTLQELDSHLSQIYSEYNVIYSGLNENLDPIFRIERASSEQAFVRRFMKR